MNFFHRKAIIIVALVCIAVIAALFVFQRSLHPSKQESGDEIKFESKVMKLTSIAFEHNQSIP